MLLALSSSSRGWLESENNGKGLRDAVRQVLRVAGEDCCAGGVGGQQPVAGGLPISAGQDLCVTLCLACVHACLGHWRLLEDSIGHWGHIGARYLH